MRAWFVQTWRVAMSFLFDNVGWMASGRVRIGHGRRGIAVLLRPTRTELWWKFDQAASWFLIPPEGRRRK